MPRVNRGYPILSTCVSTAPAEKIYTSYLEDDYRNVGSKQINYPELAQVYKSLVFKFTKTDFLYVLAIGALCTFLVRIRIQTIQIICMQTLKSYV